jgi:peptide/nickel transport system permease protein
MLMDYVKFARAKGLSPFRVIGVHVLKNILVPVTTVTGLELGSTDRLLPSSPKRIFAWPGMGKLHHRQHHRASRPPGRSSPI